MESTRQGSGSQRQAQHGVLAEAVQYRYNKSFDRILSHSLELYCWMPLMRRSMGPACCPRWWSPILWTREAYVYIKAAGHSCSPKINNIRSAPAEDGGCIFWSNRRFGLLQEWTHITTLGKSSHSRTYRVSWVCWHGPKKVGKWHSRRLKDSNAIRLAAAAAAAANHMSDHLNFRFWG